MSGRAVGVFQRKPFNRRCMILGEGDVPPPSPSAQPQIGDSPSIRYQKSKHISRFW